MTRMRRAGSRWRLLVHDMAEGGGSGISRNLHSHRPRPWRSTDPDVQARIDATTAEWSRTEVWPNTEFDELVVGQWCHIEQMDVGYWWANLGGVTVHVRADRDGRPRHVMVHGPLDYDGPVDGCEYECVWTDTEARS